MRCTRRRSSRPGTCSSRSRRSIRASPVDRETGAAVAFNLLFHRAVLETQLAGADNLAAAVKDYEKDLARSDVVDETVLSNLAEAYMMLGRLDDAIDTYRQALRTNRSTETMYDLAVALDRDERTDQAHDVISAQGEQAMAEFHRRVAEHVTFFVPEGEDAYDFALAYESFGMTDSAIETGRSSSCRRRRWSTRSSSSARASTSIRCSTTGLARRSISRRRGVHFIR